MKIRTVIAAAVLLTATPSFANGNTPENKYGVVERCNTWFKLPPAVWTHWIPCISAQFRMY